MALKLRLDSGPEGAGETRVLSVGKTLSLGRGQGNDWVLADPERHLSKTHCVISWENGRYILTDLSKNGVHVNGAQQPTAPDSRTVLTDGDEFRLGPYIVTVTEVEEPVVESNRPAGPFREGGPLDVDPLEDPLGRASDPAFRHPLSDRPVKRRFEDDAFDRDDERKRRPVNPDEDLYRGISSPSPWKGPTQRDHADAPQHAFAPPRIVHPPTPEEINLDELIGDLESALGSAPTTATAAPVVKPEAAPSAARDATAPLGPDAGCARGLAAFLEGAGVPSMAVDAKDSEAALRTAGEIFRVMAEGIRELLISRAAIKGEMRIEQTIIRARDNNALKFCASADEAVTTLLGRDRPGYITPLAAAREAFADVKSHELAVMVGVQTALMGLLRRLDPDALETRMAQGPLGHLLPSARKARYWQGYRQLYNEIAREAEEDFQAVFGRAFAKAYKARTHKD